MASPVKIESNKQVNINRPNKKSLKFIPKKCIIVILKLIM